MAQPQRQRRATARSPAQLPPRHRPTAPALLPRGVRRFLRRTNPPACVVSTALPLLAHCGSANNFSRLGTRTRLGSHRVRWTRERFAHLFLLVFSFTALSIPFLFPSVCRTQAKRGNQSAAINGGRGAAAPLLPFVAALPPASLPSSSSADMGDALVCGWRNSASSLGSGAGPLA